MNGYGTRFLCMVMAAALAGCATNGPRYSEDRTMSVGAARVIRADRLGEGGYLMDALVGRVANLTVRRNARNSNCPTVTMRGQKTLLIPSEPRVYVDGTRALDTCILTTIRVDDVDRIEVYPMGVAGRAGYQNSPYGLILVFTKNGTSL